jgi:hypothetical protein
MYGLAQTLVVFRSAGSLIAKGKPRTERDDARARTVGGRSDRHGSRVVADPAA